MVIAALILSVSARTQAQDASHREPRKTTASPFWVETAAVLGAFTISSLAAGAVAKGKRARECADDGCNENYETSVLVSGLTAGAAFTTLSSIVALELVGPRLAPGGNYVGSLTGSAIGLLAGILPATGAGALVVGGSNSGAVDLLALTLWGGAALAYATTAAGIYESARDRPTQSAWGLDLRLNADAHGGSIRVFGSL